MGGGPVVECASFSSWCVLQIWEPGDSPGTRGASSGAGSVLMWREQAQIPISMREEPRASQECGEGPSLQVGTTGNRTLSDCY